MTNSKKTGFAISGEVTGQKFNIEAYDKALAKIAESHSIPKNVLEIDLLSSIIRSHPQDPEEPMGDFLMTKGFQCFLANKHSLSHLSLEALIELEVFLRQTISEENGLITGQATKIRLQRILDIASQLIEDYGTN